MFRRHLVAVAAVVVVALAVPVATAPPVRAGAGCRSPIPLDSRTTLVEMMRACFTPVVARVAPGDTVVFRNTDEMPHTVTGLGGAIGGFEQISIGQQSEHRFDSPGVFAYHCVLHPGMVGAIVVGDGVPAGGSPTVIAPSVENAAATSLDAVPTVTLGPNDDRGRGAGWIALGVVSVLVVGGGGLVARRACRRITDLRESA